MSISVLANVAPVCCVCCRFSFFLFLFDSTSDGRQKRISQNDLQGVLSNDFIMDGSVSFSGTTSSYACFAFSLAYMSMWAVW